MKAEPFALETITPKKAMEYLEQNNNIRKINGSRVRDFARAMLNQQWDLNGETIKFNCDGSLIDGQHRLAACVEANKSFRTYVVRGVKSAREVDTGAKRTVQQLLKGQGIVNSHKVAAAARMLWFHLGPGLHLYTTHISPNNIEVLDTLDAHPGLIDAVRDASRGDHILSESVLGFIYYIGSRNHNEEVARLFVEQVQFGEGLRRGDPAYSLRKRLNEARGARGSYLHPKLTLIWAIKAWNAYISGEKLHLIRWNKDEPYPELK